MITGTTSAVFPITANGTTTVTWIYADGLNTVTQTQNVIISGPNVGTSLSGSTITSDAIGAQYQWLECDSLGLFPMIVGETGQSYQPTVTGYYAVEVTEAGCTDTSSCVLVDFTGIIELESGKLTIYPNPSQGGTFKISFDGEITKVQMKDMIGREVQVKADLISGTILAENLSPGNYIVMVHTTSGIAAKEVIILE